MLVGAIVVLMACVCGIRKFLYLCGDASELNERTGGVRYYVHATIIRQ